MRSIIQSVHQFTTQQTWKSRKSALHATDDTTATQIRSSEAAEIRHYHANPSLLMFSNRHLCSRSLHRLISGSASTCRRAMATARENIGGRSGTGWYSAISDHCIFRLDSLTQLYSISTPLDKSRGTPPDWGTQYQPHGWYTVTTR